MVIKHDTQLAKDLYDFIVSTQKKVLLLLSGGSLIHQLSEILGPLMNDTDIISRLEIGLVDERYNVPEADRNSYNILQSNLIDQGKLEYHQVLEPSVDIIITGERYSTFLRDKFDDDNYLVVAILGIGQDGHIAGILPHSKEKAGLFYREDYVGYRVEQVSDTDKPFRERVTLTFSGISKLDKIFVRATGGSKLPVLKELVNNGKKVDREQIAKLPSILLTTLRDVTIYTDIEELIK